MSLLMLVECAHQHFSVHNKNMPQGAACIQSITGAENMSTVFKIIMAAIYFWLFSITFGGIVAHG
ncbi:hypothetical protein AWP95_22950 [Escherichia coli]|nr:hypothetical protein AWP95_22950 [Escherichia coli]